jgi:5-methylcytosine-specific restriction endonuclease McrA
MRWFKCLDPQSPVMMQASRAVGKHGVWECVMAVAEAQHQRVDTLTVQLVRWWASVTPRRAEKILPYAQQILDETLKITEEIRPPAGIWQEIRLSIFIRDGYTCQYCGQHGGRLECDHVMPLSKGGDNKPDNLVTACFRCNRSKGAKTLKEWRGR